MKLKLKVAIIYAVGALFSVQSLACTAVTIVGPNNDTISGRTMEWTQGWNWKVIYVPKNTKQTLTALANLNLPAESYKS